MRTAGVILILLASAVIVGVILVITFGMMGWYKTADNCLVTNCTNPTIFYQGRHRTVSHIKTQLSQDNGGKIQRATGDYYDFSPDCTKIPGVVKCYLYEIETKHETIKQITPDPIPEPLWFLAVFIILVPAAAALCVIPERKYERKRECDRNLLGKKVGVALLVIGTLYTIGVFLLMILGGIGLIDNVSEQCLRSGCTLEKTVSPSGRQVSVPKVTIVTHKLNAYRELNRLEYTYYDFDKRNCSEVSELITCCYSTAQKAIDLNRMHNPKFAYGIALLIVSCVIFGFGVSGLRSYKSQSVDLELSEPVTCVTENVSLDIDKESTDDLRS